MPPSVQEHAAKQQPVSPKRAVLRRRRGRPFNGLEIHDNLDFHERDWRAQHIGWAAIATTILAAMVR